MTPSDPMNRTVGEVLNAAAEHTPGPWMAAAKPSSVVGWPIVASPHGRLICNMAWVSPSAERSADPDVREYLTEVEANAHLIAAAPDLAEALERAEQFIINGTELGYIRMPDEGSRDPALDTLPAIQAALAKARGDQ